MAKITKGLKKLRKRVKKLTAEVADLRAERNPAPAADATVETTPAQPDGADRSERVTSPRTRGGSAPSTTASS